MKITKEMFDETPYGAIFKTVTTNWQRVHFDSPGRLGSTTLKFICKKGGGDDWAIYAGRPEASDIDISKAGDKVGTMADAQAIAGVDDEVMKLYRK